MRAYLADGPCRNNLIPLDRRRHTLVVKDAAGVAHRYKRGKPGQPGEVEFHWQGPVETSDKSPILTG